MPISTCVRELLPWGTLLCALSPLSALHNNVLLIPHPDFSAIQSSWLAERLPQIQAPSHPESNSDVPVKASVNPYSGEIYFSPTQALTPGASFQQSGEEFSEYRKKMTPEY